MFLINIFRFIFFSRTFFTKIKRKGTVFYVAMSFCFAFQLLNLYFQKQRENP